MPETQQSAGPSTGVKILILAIAYSLVGMLSMVLSKSFGTACPFWPSAGIALGALLIFGVRLWPGVLVGALLFNISKFTGATSNVDTYVIGTAFSISATLQAVAGVFLIRRCIPPPYRLIQTNVIVKFLCLAALVASVIAATLSSIALLAVGQLPVADFFHTWIIWWAGDSTGVMIFLPIMLIAFGEPSHIWRPRRLTVALPLFLSTSLAVSAILYTTAREAEDLQQRFDEKASDIVSQMEKSLAGYINVLYALQTLFYSSQFVESDEFDTFAAPFFARHPGIQALEWLPRVPGARLHEFEKAMRTIGSPSFQIHDIDANGRKVASASSDEIYPVLYVYPSAGNEIVHGFNLASDPIRRMVLERARDTDGPVATAGLRLLQDVEQQVGILVVLPVYKTQQARSLEDRRAQLKGYVLGVFRARDMITASLQSIRREGIEFSVFDDSLPPGQAKGQRRAYKGRSSPAHMSKKRQVTEASDPTPTMIFSTTDSQDAAPPTLQFTSSLDFAGRSWSLQFTSTSEYTATKHEASNWTLASGGFIFTSLLGVGLLIVTGQTSQIELEVQERTSELLNANVQLDELRRKAEAASVAKSRFLATMSHELRTPLNAIIGFSELLMEDGVTEHSKQVSRDASKIRLSGLHLLDLIDEILDVSKVEAGHMHLELSDFQVTDLVHEVEATTRPMVEKQGNQFVVTCNEPLGSMHSDVKRVRQVLLNLLTNAAKFSENGSITLTVSRETQRAGQDVLTFQVDDTGVGITPRQLTRIFEPFEQADPTTTRQFGGTGLGLAVCRTLCEMLGGSIFAESVYGRGSSFTAQLAAHVSQDESLTET